MIRAPRLAVVTLVVLGLAASCGNDDERPGAGDSGHLDAALGGSTTTTSQAPVDDTDEQLPAEIADALLGSGDLAGWQAWEDPSAPGWRDQLMPDCETHKVTDRPRCEEDAAALAEATSGSVVRLTPYPLDDAGVPQSPPGGTVGLTQFVAVFPDVETASVVVDRDSEPSLGMDTSQDDVAEAEPVQTLGDAGWRWNLALDDEGFAGGGDQPPLGELAIFRRGNVVVAVLQMWTGDQSAGDTTELASIVDGRLPR